MRLTKEHILAEIQRTATGGKALGTARFQAETGIRVSDWQGKFWVRWTAAVAQAGFEPNQLQGPRTDEDVLGELASFVRELGHFPVANEIKLKARTVPGFPWHNTFAKFGGKQALAARLREFCLQRGQDDVAAICAAVMSQPVESSLPAKEADSNVDDLGYVYMMKSGKYYKIGRTNAVGRRGYELAIQLPEQAKVIHQIKTDDPSGIEAYWHNRFADQRQNGEWFDLTAKDIAAFKRRKFM